MSHRSRVTHAPPRLCPLPLLAALIVVTACDRESPTGADSLSVLLHQDSALTTSFGLGAPLPFLSRDQRHTFTRGSIVFATVFTPATGLGPLFNSNSCASCHVAPAVGGGGDSVEVHQTAFHAGVCDVLEEIGGQVIQQHVTQAFFDATGLKKEPDLTEATGTGRRTTPSLLGFGLLEAVPDAELLALADSEDRNHNGISGRAAVLENGHVGRFGRKAVAATISDFNEGAFIYEMGITNAAEPDEQTVHGTPLPAGVDPTAEPEVSAEDFDATATFVRFLSPPPALRLSFEAERGRFVFARLGCVGCHVPALKTGPNPVQALSRRLVFAYSDLLLHDMGPGLADVCLGVATPSEFRTEPLMGLRFKHAFLHDGRAATIAEAIRLHGGEAAAARDRFLRLSSRERFTVLKFLGSL
jgi:CxxC motif-containing protein (DUF1111 family)